MKTLSFRKVNFGAQDVLSQLQMKRIIGGHSTTICAAAGSPCGPEGQSSCDGQEYPSGGSDDGCCCGDDRYNSDCDAA